MTQILEPIAAPRRTEPMLRAVEEFHYRPMPVLAVTSLILGVVSLLGIVLWIVLPLAVLALTLGLVSLVKVYASKGELSGASVAGAGVFLSLVSLGAGIAYQKHLYENEVPSGFSRVSFKTDIAAHSIAYDDQHRPIIDQDVEHLAGQSVFTKGFVYPEKEQSNLRRVLLCLDSGTCCFGGKPKLTDMIGVSMSKRHRVEYKAGKVSVAGTFRVNPDYTGQDDLEPLYEITDCDHYTQSHSDF